MKGLFKLSLFITMIALNSCTSEPLALSTKSSNTFPTTQEYSYSDVINKTIFWSDVFSIDSESYYVYFFSRTCSHCNELKDFIIEKALDREDIYFVQSSIDVKYTKDEESIIGVDNIDNLAIVGYPSLIKIEFGKVIKNIAGNKEIKKELSL